MADLGNWTQFCEIFLFPGEARNPKIYGFKKKKKHIGIQVKVLKIIAQSKHKCDCRPDRAHGAHCVTCTPHSSSMAASRRI